MSGAGIDYSHGLSNFDPETGIHYGVLAQSIEGFNMQEWADVSEPEYAEDADEDSEPVSFVYEGRGYLLRQSAGSYATDTDIWVLMSPYITLAPFCSPCAPGAGDLCAAMDKDDDWEALEKDGWPRTYALGPEWFLGEGTPYALIDA